MSVVACLVRWGGAEILGLLFALVASRGPFESYRIRYRIVLGIMFGNLGGGITEPKLFWNYFGNTFVCNGILSNILRMFQKRLKIVPIEEAKCRLAWTSQTLS